MHYAIQKKAESIKGLVDILHFSLDYFSKDKHDKARGVACYDFVMDSFGMASFLGERPEILMTVFEENVGEIGPIY